MSTYQFGSLLIASIGLFLVVLAFGVKGLRALWRIETQGTDHGVKIAKNHSKITMNHNAINSLATEVREHNTGSDARHDKLEAKVEGLEGA